MSRGGLIRLGIFIATLIVIFTIYWAPEVAAYVYGFVSAFAPLWLPVLLAYIAWPLWLTFIRSQFVSNIEYVTLELKPGNNTPKTAKPMELLFYSLYHRTDITAQDVFLRGVIRVPWSFEVAATAGMVRFYVHVPLHQQAAIESRIRSEYRDIDIDIARDYSREQSFDLFSSKLLMREFTLAKADPYPLRTYESHEHGKDRRDVFQELLEELATVPEGEHIWMSLMVRPHQRDWGHDYWAWREEPVDSLHEEARDEIQKLVGSAGDLRGLPAVTQETVTAIENALQKPSFDCGLRVAYTASREKWNSERANSIEHLFDRFGDHTLNSFESYDPRAQVGWPLVDIFAALPSLDMEYFLKLYRRRAFFAPPYYGRSFVLNTEELATMWHIPKVGRASALNRNRGSKLEPPENLPI
jgi:hypothetical protein